MGNGPDPERSSKLRFLLRSAASLASTSVVTSALGFAFWAVAARTFPATAVGQSSTAIAAMSLIAPMALLGFGTLLVAKLPTMIDGRGRVVATAAALTGAAAGGVALGCAYVLPDKFLGLPDMRTLSVALIFAAGAATQSVGLLLDQALLSTIGGGMQLGRNAVQSVAKLVLLVIFAFTVARFGGLAIFTSWVVANVVSITLVGVLLLRRYELKIRHVLPTRSALEGLHFDAVRHHALNTALMVPYFAMPIVANSILGAKRAAYFFATWSVASVVFLLPLSLATALFASSSRDSDTYLDEFRVTLRYSTLACIAAVLGMALLGRPILHIFGTDYAENGYVPLIIMCLGGLGLIVKDHHVALARITGDVVREALTVGALSILELVGAAFGATHGGLTGLTLGWLAAATLGFVVYGPKVWRAYRGTLAVEDSTPEVGT